MKNLVKNLKIGMNVVKFSELMDSLSTEIQFNQSPERYEPKAKLAMECMEMPVFLRVGMVDSILNISQGARTFTGLKEFYGKTVYYDSKNWSGKKTDKTIEEKKIVDVNVYVMYAGIQNLVQFNKDVAQQLSIENFNRLKILEVIRPCVESGKGIAVTARLNNVTQSQIQTQYRFLILEHVLPKDCTLMKIDNKSINKLHESKDNQKELKAIAGKLVKDDKGNYRLPSTVVDSYSTVSLIALLNKSKASNSQQIMKLLVDSDYVMSVSEFDKLFVK